MGDYVCCMENAKGILTKTRYIDPLNDAGFKIIFTKPSNKGLIISFLNEVLQGYEQIESLEFGKNEHHGDTDEQGAVSFDVLCTGTNGELFLVEVQRRPHPNFKERTVFYASRLIGDQAPKDGIKKWRYNLKKVYFIVIMDEFGIEDAPGDEYLHSVCLCNSKTGKIFYDKLHFIYLELPNFVIEESELETGLEKWLYSLKHSTEFENAPFYVKEPIFNSFFNTAEYSNLTKEDKTMYDLKLKNQWDYHLVRDHDMEQSELKGRLEGKLEVAREMKKEGLSITTIAKITKLSVEQIKQI